MLTCMFDHQDYEYNLLLSIVVFVSSTFIGIAYINIFVYVSKKKAQSNKKLSSVSSESIKLAKSMFITYFAFNISW